MLPGWRSASGRSNSNTQRQQAITRLFRGRFAVDIDETLAATAMGWIKFFAQENTVTLSQSPEELFLRHGLIQAVPEIKNHPNFSRWIRAELENTDPARHRAILPIEGAYQSLRALTGKFGGEVDCYVTARRESLRQVTQQRLEENKFPKTPIVFCPSHVSYGGRNQWKAGFLRIRRYLAGIIDDQVLLGDLVGQHYHGVVVSVVAQSSFGLVKQAETKN